MRAIDFILPARRAGHGGTDPDSRHFTGLEERGTPVLPKDVPADLAEPTEVDPQARAIYAQDRGALVARVAKSNDRAALSRYSSCLFMDPIPPRHENVTTAEWFPVSRKIA
jgi:hypothetical protein